MNKLSIIKNFFEVVAEKPLDLILIEIKTGYYAEEIKKLRTRIRNGYKGHYENEKRTLPTFTPTGIFKAVNNELVLINYSQYILLDTGILFPEQIAAASKILQDEPHTLAYFKSPSGKSLKIIVEVNLSWAYYIVAFLEVKEYYQQLLSTSILNSARNLPNLCYVSDDPDLFQNENHKIFQVTTPAY